jgi:hypothetical protein
MNLTILNGNITSTNSGLGGSGIGSGSGYRGNSNVMNLTILNGNITSTNSGNYSSGIGSGSGSYGNSSLMYLTILNGNITSMNSSNYGSGIGSGSGYSGNSSLLNLTILNGNITLTSFSGSGIGTGSFGERESSRVENIWLKGNISLDIRSPRVSGINGSAIWICESSLILYTNTSRVFESDPFTTGLNDLVILYSTSSLSSVERISSVSCLELGEVNVPTYDVWLMNIYSTISSWRKSLSFNSSAVRRLLTSVESPSDYLISATTPFESGYLVPGNGTGTFSIGSTLTFHAEVHLIPFATTTAIRTPTASFIGSQTAIESVPATPTITRTATESVTMTPAATPTATQLRGDAGAEGAVMSWAVIAGITVSCLVRVSLIAAGCVALARCTSRRRVFKQRVLEDALALEDQGVEPP